MNKKQLIGAAIAGVVALGLSVQAQAQAKSGGKCWGGAKAGKNDCGSKDGKHGCSGKSTVDWDPNEWVETANAEECTKLNPKATFEPNK